MTPVGVVVLCAVTGVMVSPLLCAVVRGFSEPGSDPRGQVGGLARLSVVIGILTPTLFVATGVRFGVDPAVPAYCVLSAALVVHVCIDIRTRRLPREITYSAIAVGGVLLVVAALANQDSARLSRAALGAAAALAALWIIHVASRGDLGDGDVRLAPLLGLYLGYLSLESVGVGLLLGFLLGALVGVGLTVSRRRTTSLPFGPFLAVGTLGTLLVTGPTIV